MLPGAAATALPSGSPGSSTGRCSEQGNPPAGQVAAKPMPSRRRFGPRMLAVRRTARRWRAPHPGSPASRSTFSHVRKAGTPWPRSSRPSPPPCRRSGTRCAVRRRRRGELAGARTLGLPARGSEDQHRQVRQEAAADPLRRGATRHRRGRRAIAAVTSRRALPGGLQPRARPRPPASRALPPDVSAGPARAVTDAGLAECFRLTGQARGAGGDLIPEPGPAGEAVLAGHGQLRAGQGRRVRTPGGAPTGLRPAPAHAVPYSPPR
jgi:hypothetical protein